MEWDSTCSTTAITGKNILFSLAIMSFSYSQEAHINSRKFNLLQSGLLFFSPF